MIQEVPKDPRLVDAEIAKAMAEAEKFKAETINLGWDQVLKEDEHILKLAEARQKLAHALSAEYGAESMRIQTEATQRQEQLALVSNHHYREFLFAAPVYDEAVEACLAQLAVWHRLDEKDDIYRPMNITMDSPGGSVIDGMHLFGQIANYSIRGGGKHNVTITVRGYAASMAGILLQSADERVIAAESYLMIHEVSSFAAGKIGEIKDEIKFLDRISDRVAAIFVERSKGKMTAAKFKTNWNRQDWWLTSKEALGFGFVDRIG